MILRAEGMTGMYTAALSSWPLLICIPDAKVYKSVTDVLIGGSMQIT